MFRHESRSLNDDWLLLFSYSSWRLNTYWLWLNLLDGLLFQLNSLLGRSLRSYSFLHSCNWFLNYRSYLWNYRYRSSFSTLSNCLVSWLLHLNCLILRLRLNLSGCLKLDLFGNLLFDGFFLAVDFFHLLNSLQFLFLFLIFQFFLFLFQHRSLSLSFGSLFLRLSLFSLQLLFLSLSLLLLFLLLLLLCFSLLFNLFQRFHFFFLPFHFLLKLFLS